MKKGLMIGIGLVLVIGLGFIGWFILGKNNSGEEVLPTPTPVRYVEVSAEEAPFVSLIPSSDGHWLTLNIAGIRDAETVEYELAYDTAAGVGQGSISSPSPVGADGKYEKRIMLGTESSGKYTFHEGVSGGSVTVKLAGGLGPRRFVGYRSRNRRLVRALDLKGTWYASVTGVPLSSPTSNVP